MTESGIPKRIIQTGKQFPVAVKARAVMTNLRILHPDFEYEFFDDRRVDSFIDEEFPEFRSLFDSFPFAIQKFDFFRYLVVYRYGGFYFDLDVLLATRLDPLLPFSAIFPFEAISVSDHLRSQYAIDWEIGNYAFGAAPGHPFLAEVIANCVKAQKTPEWAKPMMRGSPMLSRSETWVLNTTGPGLLSRTFAENEELRRSVAILMPDDICDDRNWHCFGDFGIHQMEGTWRPRNGWLRKRSAQYLETRKERKLLTRSSAIGGYRHHSPRVSWNHDRISARDTASTEPLVSILIPAYNAEGTIAETLRSALAQTWRNKEIIVVDDGSKDRTLEVARQFEPAGVKVVTQANQGAIAARNHAYAISSGKYIQWLDADDLLDSAKIARQMKAVCEGLGPYVLLSSAWGSFLHRPREAKFAPSSLWHDQSPVEWLIHKLGENSYMQTSTWLISRDLIDRVGPWDVRMLHDQDGEYFCRALTQSDGVHFVPDSLVYYRSPGVAFSSLSYLGQSTAKIRAHWLAMRLQIQYLRSLEESDRTRKACLAFLQTSLIYFYPEAPDILNEVRALASELGGEVREPELSWKYQWIRILFGWRRAKKGQHILLKFRWSISRILDKTLAHFDGRKGRQRVRRWK
jgi:glycosyltransferase involved in cell wall biosynthesis